MNIIFIAPPLAGKGTQSAVLSKVLDIPHISVGQLLRNLASIQTSNDKVIKAKELMASGKLVDSNLISDILEDRLTKNDCKNGYILDGFPRSLEQVLIYEKLLKHINDNKTYVILLDISFEEAAKRVINRLTCPKCGSVFNTSSQDLSPKVDNICDNCGSSLIKRDDDNIDKLKLRFDEYKNETLEVVEYYRNNNELYTIDSSKDKDIVLKQILEILSI